MMLYTCKLCGESFILRVKPFNCPFCGVSLEDFSELFQNGFADYIIEARDKKLLEKYVGMKQENIVLLSELYDKAGSRQLCNLFRALYLVDKKHLEIFNKLGIKQEQKKRRVKIYEFDEDNIADSLCKKNDLIGYLKEIIDAVNEPYISELLYYLCLVEEEHARLLEKYN
ncbi:MAG: hypothetical protein ACQESF_05070 [Nanobdellota archaeon]